MTHNMRFSIICPVYNDPAGIRDTLRSLSGLAYENDEYEVIVVDNDSTDRTPEVIDGFVDEFPGVLSHLTEREIQSSYAARNTGIEAASGEILVFIDADVTVPDDFLESIDEFFNSNADISYVGFDVNMYLPDGEDSIWGRFDVASGLPAKHYVENRDFAPTCGLAIKSEVVEEVGRFDGQLISGGDYEFGQRVTEAGFEMGFASEIQINHPARTSLSSHLSKASRIAKGRVQRQQRNSNWHPLLSPLNPLHFLPPNPMRLRRRLNGTVAFRYFVVYYLIEYLLKLRQVPTRFRM